ncbi:hypothetical protein RM445_12000 [Pseudonocardia sp. DSM 45834]|uniref:Uncharacterized protein n=1 Tax=Pseudonocardia charpentierae TaxID=3075545 RepID=A0ABU2N8I3_9PSEU|nr:hypothetical protein [Pseudonocardia sp. DSM 45834]MDT0350246.1 hypothetical protein [Pseudonocardia sp. DSM 45834]
MPWADTEEHDVASGHLLGEGALLEFVALHHVLGLRAPAGDRCAVHGGVQLAGDVDGIGVAADLTDGSGLPGLAEMVGGGLLVLVGQPDMVAELVRRDLGDVFDAVDEVVRGVGLTRALDERDGVVSGRGLGRLEVDLHGRPGGRRGHGRLGRGEDVPHRPDPREDLPDLGRLVVDRSRRVVLEVVGHAGGESGGGRPVRLQSPVEAGGGRELLAPRLVGGALLLHPARPGAGHESVECGPRVEADLPVDDERGVGPLERSNGRVGGGAEDDRVRPGEGRTDGESTADADRVEFLVQFGDRGTV